MKTREQAEAAIRDLSAVTSTRQKHRESFETLVEYIKQEPDAVVRGEIAKLLVELDDQTGYHHWAFTNGPHFVGLMRRKNKGSDTFVDCYVVGCSTFTHLCDKLREMTKAPVSTHGDATDAMARIFKAQKHGRVPEKKDVTVVDDYLVFLSDSGCE